jgi:hypothetical protein
MTLKLIESSMMRTPHPGYFQRTVRHISSNRSVLSIASNAQDCFKTCRAPAIAEVAVGHSIHFHHVTWPVRLSIALAPMSTFSLSDILSNLTTSLTLFPTMDPTSPFSPAQPSKEPEDIPLPETPDVTDALLAAVAVLAASSTVPATEPNAFLVRVRHFFSLVINTFAPLPVRQGWIILYTAVHSNINTYPAIYRYGFPTLVILVALAEWQQPGSLPCPRHLTNAIIGFTCATLLVLGILALAAFIETNKWPWEEEGWVWPWEKWLWGGTVGDFGASVRTLESPVPPTTPFIPKTSPSGLASTSLTQHNTRFTKSKNIEIPMPPPTALKRPIIIPPTPQLPGGIRPLPTPAQIHKSGIIGESPVPMKFKHFSDNGFRERYDKLQAVSDWHTGVGRALVERDFAEKNGLVEDGRQYSVSGPGDRVGSGEGEVGGKGKGKGKGKGEAVGLLEVPELILDT